MEALIALPVRSLELFQGRFAVETTHKIAPTVGAIVLEGRQMGGEFR